MKTALISLLLLVINQTIAAPIEINPPIITIQIVVNASGGTTIDGRKCDIDSITVILSKKLWDKYKATKKMQDKLKLTFKGEVLMGTRGTAMDYVLMAQQETLRKLCLSKYNAEFESLSIQRKQYIKSHFKILFQELIW